MHNEIKEYYFIIIHIILLLYQRIYIIGDIYLFEYIVANVFI